MKILFISYMIGSSASGIISARIANEMARQGHDVKLFSQRVHRNGLSPEIDVLEVRSPFNHELLIPRKLKRIGWVAQVLWFENDLLWVLKCKNKIDKLFREWHPDFVYCRTSPYEPFFLGKYIKQKYGTKILMHFTDPLPAVSEYPTRKRFISKTTSQIKQLIGYADKLSFGTQGMLNWEEELLGVEIKGKSFTSPDVVSDTLQKFFPKRNDCVFRLVYYGFIFGSRDPIPLFRAIRELNSEGVNCELYVFSTNQDSRHTFEGVHFVGRCNDREKALSNADAFVDLTIVETKGRDVFVSSKMKDYLLFNKPILSISGRKCATREIVEGLETVFSCDNDTQSIINTIRGIMQRCFEDSDYKERLHIINSFSPKNIVNKIIAEMKDE